MSFFDQLSQIVGPENVSTSHVDCLAYSRDMLIHAGIPQAIVFVSRTEQVSNIVKLSNQEKIPVVARGTGSSVTGAVLPIKGGVVSGFHQNELSHRD